MERKSNRTQTPGQILKILVYLASSFFFFPAIPENAIAFVTENVRKYKPDFSSNGKRPIFGGAFFVSKPILEMETQIKLNKFSSLS